MSKLQEFLTTDTTDIVDYQQSVIDWVNSLSLIDRLDAQEELCLMFEDECYGPGYQGDHDLEFIFNKL